MCSIDAEFVRRAKLGEKDAFGILVDRYRDAVFSICFSKCGNSADAQDLAQEAFVRAYTNLHQLRDSDKFGSWLIRITYAVCARWFRDRKYDILPLEEDSLIASLAIEDEVFRHETRYEVDRALAKLPESHRLVAVLHYLCDYTYEEIANVTNLSMMNVKVKLRTARKHLRNYLEHKFAEDVKCKKPGKSLTRRVLSGIASFEKEEIFSHMRALRVVLEYHGERVDWSYLLGASGEAFCIYSSPSWTYYSRFVHSWDVAGVAGSVYGCTVDWHFDKDFEDALMLIDDSISQGMPVVAPGVNPSVGVNGGSEAHYWFVIRGLDREKQHFTLSGVGEQDAQVPYPWRVRGECSYLEWSGVVRCHDIYPGFLAKNPLLVVRRTHERAGAYNVALESLRRAVKLARESSLRIPDTEPVTIYCGLRAFDEWAHAFRKIKRESVDMQSHMMGRTTHCGHYGGVMDATSRRLEISRRAASAYLHTLADTVPELPGSMLIDAANRYESAASMARKLFELYFDPQEEVNMRRAIAKYPKPIYFSCPELAKFWQTFVERFLGLPENREKAVELIHAIADEERAAVMVLDRLVAEFDCVTR